MWITIATSYQNGQGSRSQTVHSASAKTKKYSYRDKLFQDEDLGPVVILIHCIVGLSRVSA